MSIRRSRKAAPASAAASAAGSGPELPQECLHGIFEQLPANCIPLAIRQLSKEWSQRYMQHTAVQAGGDGFLPACAVLAALPHVNEHRKPKLLPALARRGDLEGMQQLVVQLRLFSDWTREAALGAAAAIGRLDIVRWLVEEQGCGSLVPTSRARVTSRAASGGHQHVLEYLRNQEPPCPWDSGTLAAAARGGHVQTLQWLHSNGCPIFSWRATAAAAGGGQLAALQWLHANGCPWNEHACAAAAGAGALEVLQYLRASGCPWDSSAISGAARWGQLQVVRWLHENGCPWDFSCCNSAAASGELDVLEYLVQEGCPTVAHICADVAAACGQKEVLLWLRDHGHPWTERVCAAAAARGDLQLLQWLRQQAPPCPWDSSVVRQLAFRSRVVRHLAPKGRETTAQCLEYALSNGCPWDMQAYKLVQQAPDLRHVHFPGVRRSKRLLMG